MNNKPAAPASDTVLRTKEGWCSYGPRVERRNANTKTIDVEPPAEGETPHYWGFYLWCPAEEQWRWMADCKTRFLANLLAEGLAP